MSNNIGKTYNNRKTIKRPYSYLEENDTKIQQKKHNSKKTIKNNKKNMQSRKKDWNKKLGIEIEQKNIKNIKNIKNKKYTKKRTLNIFGGASDKLAHAVGVHRKQVPIALLPSSGSDSKENYTSTTGKVLYLIEKPRLLKSYFTDIRSLLASRNPDHFIKNNPDEWAQIEELSSFSSTKKYLKKNLYVLEKSIYYLNYVYHLQLKVRKIVYKIENNLTERVKLIFNTVLTEDFLTMTDEKEDISEQEKAPKKAMVGGGGNPHLFLYDRGHGIVGPSNADFNNIEHENTKWESLLKGISTITSPFRSLGSGIIKFLKNRMGSRSKFPQEEMDKLYNKIAKYVSRLRKRIKPLVFAQKKLYLLHMQAQKLNTSVMIKFGGFPKVGSNPGGDPRNPAIIKAEETRLKALGGKIYKKYLKKQALQTVFNVVLEEWYKYDSDYNEIIYMYENELRGFWMQDEFGRIVNNFYEKKNNTMTDKRLREILKRIDTNDYHLQVADNILGQIYQRITDTDLHFIHQRMPRQTYLEVRMIAQEKLFYSRIMVQYAIWDILEKTQSINFDIKPKELDVETILSDNLILTPPSQREKSSKTSLIYKMDLIDKQLKYYTNQTNQTQGFVGFDNTDDGLRAYLSYGALLGYYDAEMLNIGIPEHPKLVQYTKKNRDKEKKAIKGDITKYVGSKNLVKIGGAHLVRTRVPAGFHIPSASGPSMAMVPSKTGPALLPQRQQFAVQQGLKPLNKLQFKRTSITQNDKKQRLGWIDIWRQYFDENFHVISFLINDYATYQIRGDSSENLLEPDGLYNFYKDRIHLKFIEAYTDCGLMFLLFLAFNKHINDKIVDENSLSRISSFEDKLPYIAFVSKLVFTYPLIVNQNREIELEGVNFLVRLQFAERFITSVYKEFENTNIDIQDSSVFIQRIFENFINELNRNTSIQKAFIPVYELKDIFMNALDIISNIFQDQVKPFNLEDIIRDNNLEDIIIVSKGFIIDEPVPAPVPAPTPTPAPVLAPVNLDYIKKNLWFNHLVSTFISPNVIPDQNLNDGIMSPDLYNKYCLLKSPMATLIKNNSIPLFKKVAMNQNYNEFNFNFSGKPFSTLNNDNTDNIGAYNKLYNNLVGLPNFKYEKNTFDFFINPESNSDWVKTQVMLFNHYLYVEKTLEFVNSILDVLNNENDGTKAQNINVLAGCSEMKKVYENIYSNNFYNLNRKTIEYLTYFQQKNNYKYFDTTQRIDQISNYYAQDVINMIILTKIIPILEDPKLMFSNKPIFKSQEFDDDSKEFLPNNFMKLGTINFTTTEIKNPLLELRGGAINNNSINNSVNKSMKRPIKKHLKQKRTQKLKINTHKSNRFVGGNPVGISFGWNKNKTYTTPTIIKYNSSKVTIEDGQIPPHYYFGNNNTEISLSVVQTFDNGKTQQVTYIPQIAKDVIDKLDNEFKESISQFIKFDEWSFFYWQKNTRDVYSLLLAQEDNKYSNYIKTECKKIKDYYEQNKKITPSITNVINELIYNLTGYNHASVLPTEVNVDDISLIQTKHTLIFPYQTKQEHSEKSTFEYIEKCIKKEDTDEYINNTKQYLYNFQKPSTPGVNDVLKRRAGSIMPKQDQPAESIQANDITNAMGFLVNYLEMIRTELFLMKNMYLDYNTKMQTMVYNTSDNKTTKLKPTPQNILDKLNNFKSFNNEYQNTSSITLNDDDNKWNFCHPTFGLYNHILREWSTATYVNKNVEIGVKEKININTRVFNAIQNLLSLPVFNNETLTNIMTNSNLGKNQDNFLEKETLKNEFTNGDLTRDSLYYYNLLTKINSFKVDMHNMTAMFDPATDDGKNNLSALGFKITV